MKIEIKFKTEIYFAASFIINLLSWLNIILEFPKKIFHF